MKTQTPQRNAIENLDRRVTKRLNELESLVEHTRSKLIDPLHTRVNNLTQDHNELKRMFQDLLHRVNRIEANTPLQTPTEDKIERKNFHLLTAYEKWLAEQIKIQIERRDDSINSGEFDEAANCDAQRTAFELALTHIHWMRQQ